MKDPENKEQAELRIEDLPEFEIWKICDETSSNIFKSIKNDEEKLKDFLQEFEDIYYFSTSPFDIEKYKGIPALYEILARYEHCSEWHKLEIMIFKIKEKSEEEKKEIMDKLREMYWENVKYNDTRYWFIVWYYWWSLWRWNSSDMKEIKEIYPVKTLK